ncbi:hypothetical protein QL285_056976 [Trifolium repens]|nr:hypothetical protein QL285_056976 [Trifolium repens]
MWETVLLEELISLLNSVTLSTKADGWGWKLEQEEGFTVKSSYNFVSCLLVDRNQVHREQETAFKVIWKCMAPSKVAGFVWMVLLDRTPTRENLARRNIIDANGLGEGVCLVRLEFDASSYYFVSVELCGDFSG